MMKLILIMTLRRLMIKLNSNCDTSLVEDESVRLGTTNSISVHVTSQYYISKPFCFENDLYDIVSVQYSTLEDMVSCSNSSKPLEF